MKNLAIAALLFATLAATRWTLAPPYLFYFDNINFALSVREFNIALHQPHPPGYPWYVVLLKALDLFIPSAKYGQLVAGAIGSLLALLLIRELGSRMFGPVAGWLAVAILILQPSFWLAGIGNQVRTFLAAGGVAVALCVWRVWKAGEVWKVDNQPPQPDAPRRYATRLFTAAAVLGVASGFRPDLLVLLFPLLATAIFPALRPKISRAAPRQGARSTAAAALAILALVSTTWFAVIVWKSGGPTGFVRVFLGQWTDMSFETTVLGGSTVTDNLRTAVRAAYWYGVGALAWIWAVPFVWRKLRWREAHAQLALLAWWWIPAFLFHAIVFVQEPDTTLDASPALALLGAWVLSQLPRPWLAGAAAVAIQAAVFFASPLHGGKDASYAWVKRVGTETAGAIDQIRALPEEGTLVVTNRSLVTSRQIKYYFPTLRVVDADSDLRQGCPEGSKPGSGPRTELDLPPASRLLWLAPADGSVPPPGGNPKMDRSVWSVEPGERFMAAACQVVIGAADR